MGSLFELRGKIALVTGGGQGIGRACALALAAAGADVAIVDISEESGAETVDLINGRGRISMFFRCDVSDQASVDSMVEAVAHRFGRLDIAVNNAGIYRGDRDEDQSKEDWDQVIGINLTGTWLCARAEMRQMIRQDPSDGKIINVASIGALIACSNGSYDSSKAGVVHLTRTLAARWGRYNINVNSISPGYVVRGMAGTIRASEERERLRQFTPLGHVMRLRDLHGPVVFLASSSSDYITGQNIVVDGGHTLSSWQSPLDRDTAPRVAPAEELADGN